VVAGNVPVLVHNCGTEDFAHGTTLEHGQNIISNGLDEGASRANLFGSKSPGRFYTVPVDQADTQAAIDTAAGWGSRQGGQTCVIVCRLPNSLVSDLEQEGLLVRTDVPSQAIFHPGAFPRINEAVANGTAQWFGPIT
jgi:hypothetical protein